ncbi:SIR2 family protein [Streptomyces sp. NPDC008317]|uniref:SIR2 family protein n=1 Tax=Streptomyces sp. NPDC008317 TaxID=3364827 RepID=UPI0036EF1546
MAADPAPPLSGSVPPSGPLVTPAGRALSPLVALATSMHSSPGVYALLLGSGVSTGAAIKTGWGIVQDLVRRAATALDPDDPNAGAAAASDPEAWWAKHGNGPLGYSDLLGTLAPTASGRQALLAQYFEADEEDRDTRRKVPGAAHKAIAQLVLRGSVRVIVTTNFDKLTERALEDVGISPQVIHQPRQFAGATPLVHSRATVIKLHGDYLDLDSRNTVDELSSYPPEQQQLLDRVLDEYGLLVCGWSADWDHALVKAVEGTRSRRYPLFWSHYGDLGAAAARITAQHQAALIPRLSADELFPDLVQRLEALDRLADAPITRDIAVARLKRALPDPIRRIDLSDLVGQTAAQLLGRTAPENYPLANTSYADSVHRYRADTDTLLHLLATGIYHDDGTYDSLWLRTVERLVRIRSSFSGSFNDQLEALRHYPALLATWTMGVAAVIAGREEFITTVMAKPTWTTLFGRTEPQPPAVYLHPWRVLPGDLRDVCPPAPGNRWLYPQSHFLRQEAREPLRSLEPDDAAYKAACNRFEFLASMISMDDDVEHRRDPWAGEFLTGENWGHDSGLANTIGTELTAAWPLLQAGAFHGDVERAKAAHARLVEWRARNHRGF